MAESAEDKDVDALITDLQSTLDKLKSSQRKDVQDEDSEEEKETPLEKQPRTPREAAIRVREHFRSRRKQQQEAALEK